MLMQNAIGRLSQPNRKEKRKIIECVLSEQQDEKYDFKMFLLTGEVGQLKRIF